MVIEGKDLIKLIKACKASGVSNLKIGDLELQFVAGEAEQTPIKTRETVKVPSAEELKDIEADSQEQMNLEDAEDELAFMAVDDPAQFEELLVQREFKDGDGNSGGNTIHELENRRIEQDVQRG